MQANNLAPVTAKSMNENEMASYTKFNEAALPQQHMLAPTTKQQQPRLVREESATTRDKRVFGGEDDDTESAMELRGPMLDVVLGLFNGIDYDDALCF